MSKSIFSRRLDCLYLVFFLVHIPVMMFIDLVPFYPNGFVPKFAADLRTYYIETYRDQFFMKPPAWFRAFAFLELIYHFPISVWAVGALLRDDPQIPLQLLIFGIETALTTLTCLVDTMSWEGYTDEELNTFAKLYAPYLGLSILMSVDMALRVRKIINEHTMAVASKKRL